MTPRSISSVLLLAAALLAPAASAQTPVRPAQYVLAPNAQSQGLDGVAMDGSGNLTFLWTNLSGTDAGLVQTAYTRRFSAADHPLGPAVLLDAARFQAIGGTVVANQRGDVLVTWTRRRPSGVYEFFLRRTSPVLPTLTLKLKGGADVAVDRNGNFIAVWIAPSSAGYRVFGQRYDADGTTRGPEFFASTAPTHSESSPSVAMNPVTGEFVVVWEVRDTDGTGFGVYGQRFGFATGRQGNQFAIFVPAVALRPSALQYFAPQVARANNGHFVVIWRNPQEDGNSVDVLGQRYDSNGVPLGAPLSIVENADIPDSHPQLAMSPKGDFVVAWDDQGTSPAWFRLFHPNGVPAGPVMIEQPTGGASYNGSGRVAYGFNGTFIYGWTNYDDNGDFGNSIAFQRFNQ
jgi:hypothetical protein